MSVKKRTTVRSSKRAVKKAAKKTATRTRKVAKKTTKKVATKRVKRVVKRVVKRPKNTKPQSVREARYGGHQHTMPTSPKAPGRLLGRTITLSAIGASSIPVNTDALAVGVARLGGIAIMLLGVALSWNLFNQIAAPAAVPQTATLIEALPRTTATIDITQPEPLSGVVPVVVSAPDTEEVILAAANASGTYVLGAAVKQAAETWQLAADTRELPDGSYTVSAYTARASEEVVVATRPNVRIRNTLKLEQAATSSRATSTSNATSTPEVLRAPTTTMPTLLVPEIRLIHQLESGDVLVFGTATPEQSIELLLLRDQQRASTTVQRNGWFSLTLDAPLPSATYELYAQASPELLSGPLDFEMIAGRLVRTPPSGDTQITSVPDSDPAQEMLVWYLLASVATVCIGAVLLLIGHHLHHTRRRPEPEVVLDPAA